MFGSLAARLYIASAVSFTPEHITTPGHSKSFVTQLNVVAVPKSITIAGPLYVSYADTRLTIISAPSSLGLSIFIFRPVLTLALQA